MNDAPVGGALQAWVPLLVPDMPSPKELMPWLDRMHSARHYSNFGPLVCELESIFARQFGVAADQLTTVANATQGLELVLQALQLPPQSRVLVPNLTFVASATAVLRAGHVPVLADVDPQTWLLTPDIARSACAETRINAVVSVATFGLPHEMRSWQAFERETGLPVVIDAAAAYGSQWLSGAEGTLVFSLHTTKTLAAGEGGIVVSTRPGLARRVRQLSNFGINLDPAVQLPVGTLADTGTNAKMSEYHAAVALCLLERWDQAAEHRRRLHSDLVDRLIDASGMALLWQHPGEAGAARAPGLLCVRLPDAEARSDLEQACQRANIVTRRWYQPLLQDMPVLHAQCIALDSPHARALAESLLGLPFFPAMTQSQVDRVVAVVKGACQAR